MYLVCHLQMLTIKIKGFSPFYFICVSIAESTLLNVSSLFLFVCQQSSSAHSVCKAKIILQWKGHEGANWTYTITVYFRTSQKFFNQSRKCQFGELETFNLEHVGFDHL